MAFTSVTWDGDGVTYSIPGKSDTAWSGTLGVDGLLISLARNAVSKTATQTLTNKTLTSPSISTIINGAATLTLPTATDTLVGQATTDTLTNKTISGASNTLTVRLGNDVTGTLAATLGGTAQSTYATGDTLYASATNTLSKLSGNITSTRNFLRQTGTGAASQAPAWDTIVAGDVPLTGSGTLIPGYTAPATYTLTITGSSANPTKGTTQVDQAYTTKVGKILTLGYTYNATTGGSIGTGTYLFSINGFTADTTYVTASATLGKGTVVGAFFLQTASNQYVGIVQLYDITHLACIFTNDTVNPNVFFGSTSNSTLNSTNVNFSFTATFPVTT